MTRSWMFSACFAAAIAASSPALAWGNYGHHMIGDLAAKNFPAEIPAFLRGPAGQVQIAELAREPDRSRNAGEPHDADRDGAHFINVRDDGTIIDGLSLAALPATREDFDTALRPANTDEYKEGWLPYEIIDGWQQLVKDFSYWRADHAGIKFAKSAADRAWLERDRKLREMLTLRDLGYWAHFAGESSQPLHASAHYNGWGDFPNPQGFVTNGGIHYKFETAFVVANIKEADVAAVLAAPVDCRCTIQAHTVAALTAALSHATEIYQFEKDGAFDNPTPEAKAFATLRLAEGVATLRDMVTDAWRQSADMVVGYTEKIPVKDIETGKADPQMLMRALRD